MTTDNGANGDRSGNEPANPTEPPARSTRPTFGPGSGMAIGVALGVVVAAVFTIGGAHSVVLIAATGIITLAGSYVLAQATGVLERIRTATRNAERYEWAQRTEIVAWLQRLIELATDNTKFWQQYRDRAGIWREDVDRFTRNVASFHDLAVTSALSGITAHLAAAHSFLIESDVAFTDTLTALARTAITTAERVRPRFWTTFERRLTAKQIRSIIGNLKELPDRNNNSGPGS